MIMKNRKLNSGFLAKVQIKYLFLVALVSGVFFILLGGFTDKTYLSILLTISVMIVYFLIGHKIVERELLTNEQFADSNYYLGFLFTLISLASSLYILSNGNMEGGLLTRLIGQFGISISTTIVGLSLRIYLLSFSPNIGSNIESFNLMIMEKLQILNDHIGHSIDQTKTFSNVIDDKVNLFIEQTLKSVERYNERLVESLDQHSIKNIFAKIYEDMDTIHNQQEERVDRIYKNITSYHERYESQTQASVKAFQESINESEKWIAEFNDTMGKSAGSIANSNSEMRKVIHNFDDFVRGLPKLFAEVNTLFEQSSKTLTNDLEEKNRLLIENFIEQKDLQNKILMERVLGENQKIIASFVSNGETQNSSVINKLNEMNEEIMTNFIQSREAGNEKIINDITVLNNKVVQSIATKTEKLNNQVVDGIMTSSTKVLGNFISSQAQKNEKLMEAMVEENRRVVNELSSKLSQQLSLQGSGGSSEGNEKLIESMTLENRRMLESLSDKLLAQQKANNEQLNLLRKNEQSPDANAKLVATMLQENRRMIESLSEKLLAQQESGSRSSHVQPAANDVLIKTIVEENRRMLETLSDKLLAQKEQPKRSLAERIQDEKLAAERKRAADAKAAANEKMRSHGNVKLPKQ